MALMSTEGWLFLLRWIHFLSGITWIGLLYYFNLVQTPFFAETEPGVRSGAQQKLLPRALWWFRWGAMITFLSGWIYLLHYWLGIRGINDPGTWKILLGGLLGTIMWANVWFVIWPKNKIVIQNAIDTAVLSIPMLFFMGSASHLAGLTVGKSGLVFWIVALLIMILVEINALVGTPGKGGAKPLGTVKGTLWFGFLLTVVYYIWFMIMQ
jgi:uncharacterized membrane protein